MEDVEGNGEMWLVLENKKPVVAFPDKHQAERYIPFHTQGKDPFECIMEIRHLNVADFHEHLKFVIPPRYIPSIGAGGGGGGVAAPWMPPKLGPGKPPSPFDHESVKELLEKYKIYKSEPEHYGPVPKWDEGFAGVGYDWSKYIQGQVASE